jgi:cysteinyl-tRNA synthetase
LSVSTSACRGPRRWLPWGLEALKRTESYRNFSAAMDDDFNTREAIAVMYQLVKEINSAAAEGGREAEQKIAELKAYGNLLGILQEDPRAFLQFGAGESLTGDEIEARIAERNAAKKAKDFARADAVRQQLLAKGDCAGGYAAGNDLEA